MTDKELRKLQRMELLEILVDQRRRIDELLRKERNQWRLHMII